MCLFRTNIEIPKSNSKIAYNSKTIFVGSCFTENIGNKLYELKFPVEINPFGIQYNPKSVKNSLSFLIDKKVFTQDDIHFTNEQWFSFYHHSKFSNSDKEKCLFKINEKIRQAAEFLENADTLFITFGTAWVYQLNETKEIVSNCHKLPANQFNRFLLDVDDIYKDYLILIKRLLELNNKLKIIFTVSPIRHLKDGAVGNQISKSTLILAVNKLKKHFSNVEYFPSYEIMMDDLRDYRFYADDMFHINETAINYIWQKFSETYFDDNTQDLIKKIKKIVKNKNHKPFNPKSQMYKDFLKNNLEQINKLLHQYPYINLEDERNFFSEV
ncbi:MAG: GSCFA domain-containing protein [Bacteroidetes bacterium]|nr:GSCFA domain-containing protein [Bacteroidota bacterium]